MSHLTSKFKSTPTYTFKSRNQTITSTNRDQLKPSPCHYDNNPLEISKNSKMLGKFGRSSRIDQDSLEDTSAMPGPGAYQSTSSINLGSFHKGQTLKLGQKRFKENLNETPGPTHYNSIEKQAKSVPRYSFFRQKREKQSHSLSQLPAPDCYNLKYHHNSSANFSIGHAKRAQNILPVKTPGPGTYIQQREFASNTSFNQKSQILPKAKRMNSQSNFDKKPAPNSYNSQSLFDENLKKQKGFTCRQRYSHKQPLTPSPNHYNHDLLDHKYEAKVGFPRAKRQFLTPQLRRSASTPGPGSHQLQSLDTIKFKSSHGSKFSKSKLANWLQNRPISRISFINPEKLDINKRSIPKYTIPTAKNKQEAKLVVDKFYDAKIKTKFSQRNIIIPKEKRMQDVKISNLGPGYYSTQITTVTTKKIKFSKEKRRTFMDEAVISKLKLFRDQSYENREEFPNPPKYMNVHKKLTINDKAIHKY